MNWKTGRLKEPIIDYRRPPCEVVNWKKFRDGKDLWKTASTSLWGRELKEKGASLRPGQGYVDLLVRSWIERLITSVKSTPGAVDLLVRSWIESLYEGKVMVDPVTSTSLWGRELKEYIFLVFHMPAESTSLWGRELKEICFPYAHINHCRPPCEVVNWKNTIVSIREKRRKVDLLVRSWIERPYSGRFSELKNRRPPCEVVNWKIKAMHSSSNRFSRPPCEVVNWKGTKLFRIKALVVDLLVRSWIERLIIYTTTFTLFRRPPCEVVNWKRFFRQPLLHRDRRPPCEVVNWKNYRLLRRRRRSKVDLLVRSWIERTLPASTFAERYRRPPCEVVNWKTTVHAVWVQIRVDLLVRSWIERSLRLQNHSQKTGRPPCEVVNWKNILRSVSNFHLRSTSLWGRELKDVPVEQNVRLIRRPPCEVVNWKNSSITFSLSKAVDLLVRSWIESELDRILRDAIHRRPPCEVVNWKVVEPSMMKGDTKVDLLVRSWIERRSKSVLMTRWRCRPPCEVVNWKSITILSSAIAVLSTSLWGRELKGYIHCTDIYNNRRPPCEVVNWKTCSWKPQLTQLCRPPCEVVNWKYDVTDFDLRKRGRPPCEVVNWKTRKSLFWWRAGSSTSLWGRELKDPRVRRSLPEVRRPPCEVVNWKNSNDCFTMPVMVDLLVRSWIESLQRFFRHVDWTVDLLVRSWIESLIGAVRVCGEPGVDLLVRSWIES